jgi:hypothetical protein
MIFSTITHIEHANTSKKSTKSSSAFTVRNMNTSAKFVATTQNANFAHTIISSTNAKRLTIIKNASIAMKSTRREAFNATSKRKKKRN